MCKITPSLQNSFFLISSRDSIHKAKESIISSLSSLLSKETSKIFFKIHNRNEKVGI